MKHSHRWILKIAKECEEPFTANSMRRMLVAKHGTNVPDSGSIGVFLKRNFKVIGKHNDANLYKGERNDN